MRVKETLQILGLKTLNSRALTFLSLEHLLWQTCNCKFFLYPLKCMQIFPMSLAGITTQECLSQEPRSLGAIPLKCKHQRSSASITGYEMWDISQYSGRAGANFLAYFPPHCKTTSWHKNMRKFTFLWLGTISKHRWLTISPPQFLKISPASYFFSRVYFRLNSGLSHLLQ